ncbi:hypothetical protein CH63R_08905 [Colletotrichum higginsianum IMI 349063]|uniref:Uncharacterized protein n=1 Tax=Colletotrichum higginsianum (strain IMI 349063) TaxID=759273 RepID=A0A1B7Y5W6_COLHI|nr:hypothetical protein CH63R_08905 [Colletotrichum higginsianum IMI 349063]OBR07384.1 hypothetical protein CH63R_08905 [Colletotrichum higginsianum IMI 349063]
MTDKSRVVECMPQTPEEGQASNAKEGDMTYEYLDGKVRVVHGRLRRLERIVAAVVAQRGDEQADWWKGKRADDFELVTS